MDGILHWSNLEGEWMVYLGLEPLPKFCTVTVEKKSGIQEEVRINRQVLASDGHWYGSPE